MKIKRLYFRRAVSLVLSLITVMTAMPLTVLNVGAANTWTCVGMVSNIYTTPDSGLYSTSSSANAGNCYKLTKSGSTYTVQNTNDEYMNIDSSGIVTWTASSQNITLASDSSSNITAYTSDGTAATSVLNGVKLYSVTTEQATGTGGYLYTLDTDGIDYGEPYIIVAPTSENLLYRNGTAVGNFTDFDIIDNTITLATDTYDWTFTITDTTKDPYETNAYDGSYYLLANSGSVAVQTSTAKIRVSNATNGYYQVFRKSGKSGYYSINYSNGWTATNNGELITTNSTTTYLVRLFKYTSEIPGGEYTVYKSGEQFTAVKAEGGTKHYVLYTDSEITLEEGEDSAGVEALIRAGSSTLQYAENSSGTGATSIPLSDTNIVYKFTGLTVSEEGVYSVPVYYTDNTVDTPTETLIGYQTVTVTAAAVEPIENEWIKVGTATVTSSDYSTPDSGLYSVSSSADSSTCYQLTKNGSTYTIKNMSGLYMNIDASGNVSWSSTAQSLTLKSNSSGKITAYHENGTAAKTVFNGVNVYSATSSVIPSGLKYVYTLDTDGVDANSNYLIVAEDADVALTHSGTTVTSTDVTISSNKAYADANTYAWTISGSSNGTVTNSNYYLRLETGGYAEAGTKSSTNYFGSLGDGRYTFVRRHSGNQIYYHLDYSNGSWLSVGESYGTTNSTYNVRLYKYTGTENTSSYTSYSASSTAYTPAVVASTDVEHFVHYDGGVVTVVAGLSTDAVESIIRNSSSVSLQYAENGDGTGATDLSLNSEGLTFDFTNVDLNTKGTYPVAVYYYDSTVNNPTSVLIGYQQLVVKKATGVKSAVLDTYGGSVALNAASEEKTGANIVITFSDDSVAKIPVTLGMLVDNEDGRDIETLCTKAGVYTGLTVYYDFMDGYTFDDFVLTVDDADNYPEYPNVGSVKVSKGATTPDWKNEGVAEVELSATGVPMNPGIDIVVVIDTSSSMQYNTGTITINGTTIDVFSDYSGSTWYDKNGNTYTSSDGTITTTSKRLECLKESLKVLVEELSTPNATTGIVPDIDIAIADFNGYQNYREGVTADDRGTDLIDYTNDHLTDASWVGRSYNYKGGVLTGSQNLTADAFVDIENLTESFDIDNDIDGSKSGTNYDFAFDYMYDLMAAKQAENEANGESRQMIGIFMSDGCPYQFNFFSTTTADNWDTWLDGTYDSYTDVSTPGSHAYFYNGAGNTHRKADAIKGDTDTDYVVIDKRYPTGTADATGDGVADPYMTTVKGLGAKLYSIGFCIAPEIVDYTTTVGVLEKIASDESTFYNAGSGDELTYAFADIASQTVQAGYDAYYIDTLGDAYDIQLASVYEKNGTTYTLTETPVIKVTDYTVYTREDYENGVDGISYDDIGLRTGESEVIEKVTFNSDGTAAYSDKINSGTTNILTDGVIRAKNFIYNSTDEPILVDADKDGVAELTLPAESFYWRMDIIPDTEFVLSYYVYLTGSMEGTRNAGTYPTNESATLYYTNYLDNFCHKDTVSPILPWEAATVSYEFYLVNADGEPVNSDGTVVPFTNRVLVGNPQTDTIFLNSTSTQDAYTVSADANLPDGYVLYNPDAYYTIKIDSGTTPSSATITDLGSVPTTYYYSNTTQWKGNGTVPSSKVTNYGATNVAFAIVLVTSIVPDEVVIDYGLPVKIHVLANDLAVPSSTVINSIVSDTPTTLCTAVSEAEFDRNTELSLENGDVTISADGKCAVYTPKNATMSDEEVFYYEVLVNGSYYYAKVTVIPATNIYYEESFFTFTNGSGYNWTTAGETYQDAFQAEDRPGTFAIEECDANNNYGRDTQYDDETATYSLGSAMSATVDGASFGNEPKATFTFCGTGFDLFSITSNKSGVAIVNVQSITEGVTYNKNYIINTYYGYSYGQLYVDGEDGTDTKATLSSTYKVGNRTYSNEPLYETGYKPGYISPDDDEIIITVNGKVYSTVDHSDAKAGTSYDYAYGWITTSGEDADEVGIYQIPVVSIPAITEQGVSIGELEYATYKVTVTPKYSANFDKTGCGEYTFCVDGIRIYNPAGKDDYISEVVSAAYEKDMESNPQYAEVRDAVISDEDNFLQTVSTGSNVTVGGALFLDGMTALGEGVKSALNKYKETGPNNETYLYDGQAIAFKPEITDCLAAPASFQLGMKVIADGETDKARATVKIIISDSETAKIQATKIYYVSGSAEQYYDITDCVSWTESSTEENKYTSRYSIVVLNDSDAVVALTSFKWTYLNSEAVTTNASDNVTPKLSFASSADTLEFAEEAIMSVYGTVDTSEVSLSWLDDNLTEGAKARLKITTSQEVEKITVGNTDITLYEDGEDGLRYWTYDFTVTQNGDYSFDVTLTDSRGRVSEVLRTDVLTVEETTEAAEETTTEETVTEEPTTEEPTTNEPTEEQKTEEKNESFFARLLRNLKFVFNFIVKLIKKILGK